MATIVTRAGKGSPLTNTEVDSNFTNLNTDKAELSGAAFTGAITTTSTVDGRDVAADGVTADAALPKAGGAMTGAITTNSTFDGRDVATDGTKLDGIESGATADQTGAEIKTAYEGEASAFTDAQFTKLGGIETGATADQTGAQIKTAYEAESNAFTDTQFTKLAGIEVDATADQTGAQIKTAYEGEANAFTDAQFTKLGGIEASADVTDTANVTSSGALMDSELTDIASVKALDQGVATTDSPSFEGDGEQAVILDRLTSDGTIADFRKDGTTVGSIGYNSSNGFYIHTPYGNDAGLVFGSERIVPCTSTGAFDDAVVDLGYSSGRFKDLYLSGGIYLGGTGAANKLDDYEEGTWTAVHGGQNMGTAGRYTKVGQMVTLVLDATSHASATSSTSISGLPFTITSSHSAFNIGYTNSAAGLTGGYCSVNANNLTFVTSGGISGQSLGASERVMLTATYVTTT